MPDAENAQSAPSSQHEGGLAVIMLMLLLILFSSPPSMRGEQAVWFDAEYFLVLVARPPLNFHPIQPPVSPNTLQVLTPTSFYHTHHPLLQES